MDAICCKNLNMVVVWLMEEARPSPNTEIFKCVFWASSRYQWISSLLSHGQHTQDTSIWTKYQASTLVTMLVAVRLMLIPLAFVIIETENNDTSSWHITCTCNKVTTQPDLRVTSDHQKGILPTMNNYLGLYPHQTPSIMYYIWQSRILLLAKAAWGNRFTSSSIVSNE